MATVASYIATYTIAVGGFVALFVVASYVSYSM